jgi:hypothetical protein
MDLHEGKPYLFKLMIRHAIVYFSVLFAYVDEFFQALSLDGLFIVQIGLSLLDPGLFNAFLIDGLFEVLWVDLCAFVPLEVLVFGQEYQSEACDDEPGEVLLVIDRLG